MAGNDSGSKTTTKIEGFDLSIAQKDVCRLVLTLYTCEAFSTQVVLVTVPPRAVGTTIVSYKHRMWLDE